MKHAVLRNFPMKDGETLTGWTYIEKDPEFYDEEKNSEWIKVQKKDFESLIG